MSGILMFALGFITMFFEVDPLWGILLISMGAITVGSQFMVRISPFSMSGLINFLNAALLAIISATVTDARYDSIYLMFAAFSLVYLIVSITMWKKWFSLGKE